MNDRTPPTGRNPWLVLAGFLTLSIAVLSLGGAVTAPAIEVWYQGLAKPPWTPPDWLFGPVWTALYLAMAVAAWLVWRRWGWQGARCALILYLVQLGLNFLWSPAFFGLRDPLLGMVVIAPLWLAVAATTVAFFRKQTFAGSLFVPYLAWASYAVGLNAAILALN
jgi:tryptophan-rich sensory protein